MRLILTAAALSCLAGAAAFAADAKVEAAVKTFAAIETDAAKVKTYCEMSKLMADVGEDEKKAEAADAKMTEYFKVLGPDFEAAWNAGEDLKDDSPDLKVLDDAVTKLQAKCSA